MLQAILHRGPDDVGAWQDSRGDACLLHARLALVDLDGGRQPMAMPGGDIVVAFNGEIYGFARWRRELEARGAVFHTSSDTEVLLHLYRHFGPDFVSRLEGEFAFALVDRGKGRTMLARDRFGEKPLFTSMRNGLLLFGSEAKAILAHPWTERRLDLAVLSRELHGTYLPQDCLFAGISAVEPGTYLLASRQGVATHRYFRLEPEAAGTARLSFDEATEALESTLSTAVRERFHGDAPVGLFLSGGVDSSAVAALASEVVPAKVSAYSIDFVGTGESERAAAELAAARLGLRGVVREVAAEDMAEAFETSVWHAEATVPNPHGTAKLLLARRAKQDVKAVLTGEGSDELHAGYAYFEHARLLMEAGGGRGSAALSQFLADYGPRDGVMPGITPKLRAQMAWSVHGGAPYAAMRARSVERHIRLILTPEFRGHAETTPSAALMDWLSASHPDARMLDDVALSRLVSLLTDLPRYNLCFLGDRPEMANGLEARLPFLDTRVVDLMWRMPFAFHRAGGEGKRILRRLLTRRLPITAARPKRNFLAPAAPAGSLLRGPLAERWLSRAASRRAGIYRPTALAVMRQFEKMNRGSPSLRFYLGSLLTMALSAHLIGDMFCDRFSETLTRRSAMSLSTLRSRLSLPTGLARAAQ
jgi:asparagine synthase (glutamine-hydrolysing)